MHLPPTLWVWSARCGRRCLRILRVSFEMTHGWIHLVSEMLLCIYVTSWYNDEFSPLSNRLTLSALDFAVLSPGCLRVGWSPISQPLLFFWPVAAVALSTDQHELLKLLDRQRALKADVFI